MIAWPRSGSGAFAVGVSGLRSGATRATWRKPGARDENRQIVRHAAKAGNVILFESWLRHEVEAGKVRGERVSISFNYTWR